MNILELVDLAVLLEAFPKRHKTKLDVVPVVKSGIGDDRTINGKEVDAILVSNMCVTSQREMLTST